MEAAFPGDRVIAPPERARPHPDAFGKREHDPVRLGHDRCLISVAVAREHGAGEGVEDRLRHRLVVLIPVRVSADLDGLGGLAGVELLPAGDVEQPPRGRVVRPGFPAVEGSSLVARVHEFRDRAPAAGGAHLEQAERVMIRTVAIVRIVRRLGVGAGVGEHPQGGFGERGHERDEHTVAADAGGLPADRDDRRRVRELLPVQRDRLAVAGRCGQRVRDRADRE